MPRRKKWRCVCEPRGIVFSSRPKTYPAGDSYDDRIRNAIGRSHAFLCFLTPEYLTPGRYTLTELEIARRRWPSPAGHVFPIRLANIPVASIPAYLRAVTIMSRRATCRRSLLWPCHARAGSRA